MMGGFLYVYMSSDNFSAVGSVAELRWGKM